MGVFGLLMCLRSAVAGIVQIYIPNGASSTAMAVRAKYEQHQQWSAWRYVAGTSSAKTAAASLSLEEGRRLNEVEAAIAELAYGGGTV